MSRSKSLLLPVLTLLVTQFAGHSRASAQLTIPALAMSGPSTPERPISAAEAEFQVEMQAGRVYSALSPLQEHFPKDSIQSVMTESASRWMNALQSDAVKGMQLDPYGAIAVGAHHEAIAEREIAARLATPGLSLHDKAFTYFTAVSAFASADFPERLPAAERYMVGLDALGPAAAFWQHRAHSALLSADYLLGRTADVIRNGTQMIISVGQMEFPDRERWVYTNGGFIAQYAKLVDALSGQPDGRTKIQALNATLIAAAKPSGALVSLDSAYYWSGVECTKQAQRLLTTGMRIGTRGDDIVGNYWVNMPNRTVNSGPLTVPVADGKIHIVDIGTYTCPGCRTAMVALQRIQDRFPSIQVVTVTWTIGYWANRLVEPEVEAERLKAHYTERLKIHYPISIWMGEKKPNVDGGITPEDEGPNVKNYPLEGKPNIYVIDGKGIIRRLYVGLTRDDEAQLAQLLVFLQREAGNAGTPVVSTSAPTPVANARAH